MEAHDNYDVVLSFAGEDREYAEALANLLLQMSIKVFYDNYQKPTLWGKDLYSYLSDLYQNHGRYCVIFISKNYATKLWTNHERRAAQSRAFRENEEYILPVRLDDTEIPGILPTVGYLSWPPENAASIAEAIALKLQDQNKVYPAPLISGEGSKSKPARLQQSNEIIEFSQNEQYTTTIPKQKVLKRFVFSVGIFALLFFSLPISILLKGNSFVGSYTNGSVLSAVIGFITLVTLILNYQYISPREPPEGAGFREVLAD